MSDELGKQLEQILRNAGAALVGYADLKNFNPFGFPTGISVAVPIPKDIVFGIEDGPTLAYHEMYTTLNNKLNDIVTEGVQFLESQGYRAYAQTTQNVSLDKDWISPLPHKTVATTAGIGWIGKSCLLVTPEYGSAIRISSLLTDAPLPCATPITSSKCGDCTRCVDACPAHALKGTLWKAQMPREEIFDKDICYKTQREIMLERTGIDTDLCGKCFVVCPYTRNYLARK
ncbi:MAG: 4Fe-4S double cluster binding domain-containing protein [Lachnospiraceae bacterium]